MAKYQLTTKQQDILRAASCGLHDGRVDSLWILVLNRGALYQVKGFPIAVELGASETDFRVLLEYGFLKARSGKGQNRTFDVMEQRIHDAVSRNFEDPSSVSPDLPPSVNVEMGAGSYMNLSVSSQNVTQMINVSSSLPDDVKENLEREVEALYRALGEAQEEHPQESRALEKHLRRLVEDVAEPQPIKQDVTYLLSRLQKAGAALSAVASITSSVGKIVEIVGQLPFMQ